MKHRQSDYEKALEKIPPRHCLGPVGGPPCGRYIDDETWNSGLPGSRVHCRFHVEQSLGKTIEEAIAEKQEFARREAAGEFLCDVCGKRPGRWCPGEGQFLCDECNYRQGPNRWS